tara:strand:- start:7006 stop:8382 length:1377 start_codon:yes stop_codon:yes gene_type:complete
MPSKVYNNPWCNAPFVGIDVKSSDGTIGFCCVQQPKFDLQDYNNSANEFWTSADAQRVRQDFIDGKWPSVCGSCKYMEKNGLDSDVSTFDQFTGDFKPNSITGSENFKKPIYIDYRPDNLCNLACSHCTPGNSTKIEEIAKSDDKWKEIWPRSVRNVERARALNIDTDKMFIEMLSDDTRIIKLLGGEPTINLKVQNSLQYCIDNGYAKNINLKVTTNFTNLNKTFKQFDHFKTVKINASLDACGDTYNYIRQPGKWKNIRKNIEKHFENTLHQPKHKFFINLCWMVNNAFTTKDWIPELFELWFDVRLGQYKKAGVHHQSGSWELNRIKPGRINVIKTRGMGQDITAIPLELRKTVLKDLYDLREQYKDYFSDELFEFGCTDPLNTDHDQGKIHTAKFMIDQMITQTEDTTYDEFAHSQWKKITKWYDQAKGTDIHKLSPMFAKMMEWPTRDLKWPE